MLLTTLKRPLYSSSMTKKKQMSLKERRLSLGKTHNAMAIEMDVTVEAIRGWERGDHFPQRRLWDRVAAAYGISTSELASAFVGGAKQKPAPVA